MAFELAGIPCEFCFTHLGRSRLTLLVVLDHFDPPFAAIVGQLTHPDASSHSIDSRICSEHLFHLDYSEFTASSLASVSGLICLALDRGTTIVVEWITVPGEAPSHGRSLASY